MKALANLGLYALTTLSTLTQANSEIHTDQHNQYPIPPARETFFSGHDSKNSPQTSINKNDYVPPHRIAVVGAGPAGSSTAYHLRKFSNHTLNITIFDSNPYIGGRTTTVNALNDPRYPVELGASIFVEINSILFNATRDFDLPVDDRSYQGTGAKYDLGVWDGTEFVFYAGALDKDGGDGSGGGWTGRLANWWDIAKLFWRYGLSPLRLRNLQQSVIGRFLKMYDEDGDGVFPFPDLTSVAANVDLLSVTSKSGDVLLKEAGISEKFAREIVQASSRVNYAQNLYDFHGLETMVCMSTEGAMNIEGGNWQIFDRMVKFSGAGVLLNTTVTGIETTEDGISHVTFKSSNHDDRMDQSNERTAQSDTLPFDTVILAHPHNPSQITVSPPPELPLDTPDYVSLHVTLFTSPSRPHPNFFNADSSSADIDPSLIPNTILTTLPSTLDPSFLGRGISGLGLTPFWSLSTLRTLNPSTDGFISIPDYLTSGTIPPESLSLNTTQYLYKIFSPEPLTAQFFLELFQWPINVTDIINVASTSDSPAQSSNDETKGIKALPRNLITWHHEKTWQSYPYLPPRTTFESFDVYSGDQQLAEKVWRTSPMEVFISTMETMALSGRNVARLIVDGLECGR